MEACREAGVGRVVVASSDKAYGPHDELPYREDAALQPIYPYDVSKAATDLIARSYWHTYGVPTATTRFANIYGGGDRNPSRLIPEAVAAVLGGRAPVIRSDGTPERDYMYVEDAVAAYLAIAGSLDDPAMHGRAWNAGLETPVPVLELVNTLIAVSGRDLTADIRGEGKVEGEIDREFVDSTAIRTELGWAPQWTLTDGLRETYGWYARHLEAEAVA
jgi:CDP-glucose 4,6-dehydratase